MYPTRPSTSTTKFDTETIPPDDYETYTGTGTGSYTGGDGDDYEYGRLKDPAKKPEKPSAKQRKIATKMPTAVKLDKSPARIITTTTNGRTLNNSSGGRDMETKVTTRAPKGKSVTTVAGDVLDDKRNKRPIRSVRHLTDVLVSFEDWKRKQRRKREDNEMERRNLL